MEDLMYSKLLQATGNRLPDFRQSGSAFQAVLLLTCVSVSFPYTYKICPYYNQFLVYLTKTPESYWRNEVFSLQDTFHVFISRMSINRLVSFIEFSSGLTVHRSLYQVFQLLENTSIPPTDN